MIDFPKPIDPFEHVKIPEVKTATEHEKNKKPLVQKPVSKKLFVYFSFLKILSNLLSKFTKKTPKDLDGTPLHKEILTIKKSLKSLKDTNLCQDSEFLNYFAFVWMKFLRDYDFYVLKNEKATKLIKKIIDEVNEYPKNAEFTLGYYISEFAGYQWVPFPYMEMLQNLHLEDKKDSVNSHLSHWISIIDELLELI
ncbi:MAG: hypothetical protein K1060chlam1_00246 [Candidatus Anoxychlamydiales bacterium]|nr:hypothetical protein [Candidatus Anoxychlamydiales bacterium]